MKKWIPLLVLFFANGASAQLDEIKKKVKSISADSLLQTKSNPVAGSGNDKIVQGLKQALEKGTQLAVSSLGKEDGFMNNPLVALAMPPEAKDVQKTMRKMGMGSLVDKAILSMNRAAEDATAQVAPIFLNAIKGMTLQDGLQILQGGDRAATQFLQNQTSTALQAAIRPVVDASLQKVKADQYWKAVFTNYNRISLQKVNTDLGAYVTAKTIEGIFTQIGEEEMRIRKDPVARTTDLLKDVFGHAGR